MEEQINRTPEEEEKRQRALQARAARERRHRRALMVRAGTLVVLAVILVFCVIGVSASIRKTNQKKEEQKAAEEQVIAQEEEQHQERQDYIDQAETMAKGYYYDEAIELLKGVDGYESMPEVMQEITTLETQKATMTEAVDVSQVTHVFFHTLVADPDIAFNLTGSEEYKIGDYNQVMTTVDEFNAMMQQMYDRGFVLVNIRDLVTESKDEAGNTVFTKAEIRLPVGKKPFVLSQDDVCYYFYMQGDGFADKLVVGDDGKPTNEYTKKDGTTVTGSYDVVPLLDDFIEEHPDFSYKGAKGILALTGYNGILGYRTDPDLAVAEDDHPAFDVEDEIAKAKVVVQCLKDDGWELASHSYGHISYGQDLSVVKEDNQKWQDRVGKIIGGTDIILYPFGTDIGDWHPYTTENQKFDYLYEQGFRYFCNVDGNQYWVQIGDNYVRQGRRNLDGYRMYQDLYNGKDMLGDLFDVASVYDKKRPTTGLDNWDGAG